MRGPSRLDVAAAGPQAMLPLGLVLFLSFDGFSQASLRACPSRIAFCSCCVTLKRLTEVFVLLSRPYPATSAPRHPNHQISSINRTLE